MHFIYVRNARRVTTKCIKTVKDDVDLFSKVPPNDRTDGQLFKKNSWKKVKEVNLKTKAILLSD